MNITLDETDLMVLMNGGVVSKGDVHIILAAIGFDRMQLILNKAIPGLEEKGDGTKG